MIYYLYAKHPNDGCHKIYAIDTSIDVILRMKGAYKNYGGGIGGPTWILRASISDVRLDVWGGNINLTASRFLMDL